MRRLVTASVLMILLAGCSGANDGTVPNAAASPSVTASPSTPTGQAAGEVDDAFDVGEYELYMTCAGTGSPTVVFVDGLGGGNTLQMMQGFAPRLTDRYRFCSYDRVNTGRSDRHQDMHTGADSVRDLNALLAAAHVPGPYLLLSYSWGSLLALMYAGTYPDDVMGAVLLDPNLPTDDTVERALPPGVLERLKPEWNAVEREDLYRTLEEAKQAVRSIPDVPVTAIAAEPRQYDPTWPVEQMRRLHKAELTKLVDGLTQGRLVTAQSGHDLASEQPDLVVAELQRIVAAS